MVHDLPYVFVEGMPYDEQTKCVEAFFDEKDPTWVELGYVPFTGSDEESQAMIKHALTNIEHPDNIREMLEYWRDSGF